MEFFITLIVLLFVPLCAFLWPILFLLPGVSFALFALSRFNCFCVP